MDNTYVASSGALEGIRAWWRQPRTRLLLLGILPVVVFLISLPLGRYPISIPDLLRVIGAKLSLVPNSVPDTVRVIIWNVRLPRLLAAMVVGGGLSLSGAAYQGMFRNPLVSPDILGAAAGASFGAALGIMLSVSIFAVQGLAFAFGLGAVALTMVIGSRLRKGDPILMLVLTGILIGTVFSSLVSGIKYLADPYQKLPAITFWLMGSLAGVTGRDLLFLAVPALVGAVVLFLLRWRLNTMAFGEEEARTLGVNTRRTRGAVIVAATLMTASAVSVCGVIGWVGLVIPHLARSMVGSNFKTLIPASFLLGCTYLLVVDDVARLLSAVEVPIGILTALVGAPWFLLILSRRTRGWA